MTARTLFIRGTALLALIGLTACEPPQQESMSEAEAEAAAAFYRAGVMQVTAGDFEFDAPDEIPSGWSTIRMDNVGEQEHFLYLYRLPDSVTYSRFQTEAMGAFNSVWNRYDSGELTREEAGAAFGQELPEWFLTDITPAGGVGLTEPGEIGETTVRLEPGTYVMECYVKTPQGTWHTERGMQKELTVRQRANSHEPPTASVAISVSNYEIAVDGEFTPGEHRVAITVEENPEGFTMHDLNLVRLDGTTVDEVVAWMDWMDLEQFRAPAPGFSLGGVKPMVAGRTAYVTVELTPGDYAWVSEGYGAQGVVHTFTIQ